MDVGEGTRPRTTGEEWNDVVLEAEVQGHGVYLVVGTDHEEVRDHQFLIIEIASEVDHQSLVARLPDALQSVAVLARPSELTHQ